MAVTEISVGYGLLVGFKKELFACIDSYWPKLHTVPLIEQGILNWTMQHSQYDSLLFVLDQVAPHCQNELSLINSMNLLVIAHIYSTSTSRSTECCISI